MKKSKISEFPFVPSGGECIGYVITKYNGKGILCKPVFKRRVKQTPRQQGVQERFTEAARYAKYVMQDPEKRKAYEDRLTKINGSLYPAILTDYLKYGEKGMRRKLWEGKSKQ